MKNIYVVSGRFGCGIDPSEVFYTREEADNFIKQSIAADVINDFYDELKEAHIEPSDTDKIIQWGQERDYCSEDTYMVGDDWHELMLCCHEIEEELLEEKEEDKEM